MSDQVGNLEHRFSHDAALMFKYQGYTYISWVRALLQKQYSIRFEVRGVQAFPVRYRGTIRTIRPPRHRCSRESEITPRIIFPCGRLEHCRPRTGSTLYKSLRKHLHAILRVLLSYELNIFIRKLLIFFLFVLKT